MVTKKIGDINDGPVGRHRHFFMCPGCGYAHCFTVQPGEYNNDPVNPTVNRQIVIPGHLALFHCESRIAEGMITFSNSCSHEHSGYTYELPPIKKP